jgi:hypothetical protein
MPYMLATWVPGKAVAKNIIDFERKDIWFDPMVRQYPDILIYDKDYKLKFALDGVEPNLMKAADKGYLFPWRSGQVLDIDPINGRVQIGVDLAPDDIIFGFYSYIERDFIYFDIDVNPYSNPAVKDCVIRFFHKPGDPHRPIPVCSVTCKNVC